ncbi:hypothetical protein B1748_27120 [Paenibacillus sp. MY03]|nr:hypothetical protein B1748_27120 [Paenibacillus sp. MY03]
MNCPVCDDVRMKEVQKEDVLIDVCPACKGVWLDRGELEKLLQGVREVRDDYERMEQEIQNTGYGGVQAPPNVDQGQAGAFGNSPGGQAGYSGAPAPGAGGTSPGYGSAPGYDGTGRGGYQPPPPQGGNPGYQQPHSQGGNPGYQQPPGQYGQPGYGQPGYGSAPGQGYGYGQGNSKYGYDKYGRPYKKKKTMLDVFGDLFD